MNTEIYCTRFTNAELATIPSKVLALAFNELASTDLNAGFPSSLPPSRHYESISFTVTEAGASGLVISRPFPDNALYEALLCVLRLEGVVAYAPCSAPIVGNAATVNTPAARSSLEPWNARSCRHISKSCRRALRQLMQVLPNPSLNNRTRYGGPSWPGLGYTVHSPSPRQAVPPQRSG